VFCQLETLKECLKVRDIRETLRSLPKTLDETYERILTSINEKYQNEAISALIWLTFSQRELSILELAEAVIVKPKSDPCFDPDDRYEDPCDFLNVLTSLVTLSSDNVTDGSYDSHSRPLALDPMGSRQIVRLAHFSVKEYLLSERIQDGAASKFGVTDIIANRSIAESSVLYALYCSQLNSKAFTEEDLSSFPLLQYACELWYAHVLAIPIESQKPIEPIIFRLYLSKRATLTWLRVHRPDTPQLTFPESMSSMSPLHHASCIGLQSVDQLLLNRGAEVDTRDTFFGQTPLLLAAKNGHEAVAQLLLNKGAIVDARDQRYGQTPLWAAAENGHEAVAQLLLHKGAMVDAKDERYGWRPLWVAVENGNEAVVRLLLDKLAMVDAKYMQYGRTPLFLAAENGHEAIVALLLYKGAMVDGKNAAFGQALLWEAMGEGCEAVVRVLLETGADVRTGGLRGTAFGAAAFFGRKAVMERLLADGIDKHVVDDHGRNALHLAASGGHLKIVNYLVGLGLDVAAKDKRGFTTLYYAAAGGSFEVLEWILQSRHSNWEQSSRWSPLHWAARTGDYRMLKLLSDAGIKECAVETSEPPGKWTATSIAVFHQNKNFTTEISHDTEDYFATSRTEQLDLCTQGHTTAIFRAMVVLRLVTC
jgi:ankyrin repeat protein